MIQNNFNYHHLIIWHLYIHSSIHLPPLPRQSSPNMFRNIRGFYYTVGGRIWNKPRYHFVHTLCQLCRVRFVPALYRKANRPAWCISFSILLVGITTIGTYFATKPWQLMILYEVIAAIGFGGASSIAGSVIIDNWFVEKRGLALGLMSAGTAAGQFLLVPFSLMLIEQFDWKHTVLLLGSFLTYPPRNLPPLSGV